MPLDMENIFTNPPLDLRDIGSMPLKPPTEQADIIDEEELEMVRSNAALLQKLDSASLGK